MATGRSTSHARWPQDEDDRRLLRNEIRVAREAAEITARLVVRQFEESERIFRRFHAANTMREAVINSATQVAIIAAGQSGLITVFNPGARKMLGYTPEEVIGVQRPEIFHLPHELERRAKELSVRIGKVISADALLHRYALEGMHTDSEWHYVHKNGIPFPVSISISPLMGEYGRISGFLCIAIDMSKRMAAEAALKRARDELEARVHLRTEELAAANQKLQHEIQQRRQAEFALKESETKYRGIIENSTEGFMQSTPDGRLLMANQAFVDLFGYASPEEMKERITDISHQLYVYPHHRDLFKQAIEKSGRIRGFETQMRARDGIILDIVINAHLVRDGVGNPAYYEAMFQDVTQRKRSESLRIARDTAEAANRAKSVFLANMSHEIRTPMNAVIGLCQLALRTELTSQQRDYLNKIHSSGFALLGIINDILDFSKIEAGKLELESTDFDLQEVLDRLFDMFSATVDQKQIDLQVHVEAGVPCRLMGDPLRLGQVLINLTGNAVKFTEQGAVAVTVSRVSQTAECARLRFSVRDSGIGIPPEYLPHLGTSFSQADLSTTRRHGGTGLGLAISRQLIQLMNGDLAVESTPGKGSTFSFTAEFALGNESSVSIMDHRRFSGNRASETRRFEGAVLLVEDNVINQQVAVEWVRNLGLQVDTADSGNDALEKLGRFPYDVVLMDIQMPEMDGYTVTRRIREDPRFADLPIVAMTAHATDADRFRCFEAGMNDYLSKPIEGDHLATVLGRWLKPIPVDTLRTEETPSMGPDTFPEQIPGIDMREAARRFQDADFFRSVLERFIGRHADDIRHIREAIQDLDWPRAKHLTHELKGVAGTIAARDVFKRLSQLESILHVESVAHVSRHLNRLDAAMAEVVAGAGTLLSMDTEHPWRGSGGGETAIGMRQSLEHLAEMLKNNDLEAESLFHQLAPRLASTLPAERLSQVQDHIENLEYGAACGQVQYFLHAL